MLLMPNSDWHWGYNAEYGVLSVSLGAEMEFLTPYPLKSLIPDAKITTAFNVEHAKYYINFIERLSKVLKVSDALLVQVALNATVGHFLIKPEMPKSWFFDVSDVCVFSEVGKVFQLKTKTQIVYVVVIDSGLQADLVMLLSNECQLSETKSLKQFETIKVMHNRLFECKPMHEAIEKNNVIESQSASAA